MTRPTHPPACPRVGNAPHLWLWLLVASACAPPAPPGAAAARTGDALVQRILTAENRRDSSDAALAAGAADADPFIRLIAQRAQARIRDSLFAAREAILPAPPAPPAWPEPAWRLRLRALGGRRVECTVIRAALADSAWPVRLGAADAVARLALGDSAQRRCGTESLVPILQRWIDTLPVDLDSRGAGGVSWHGAAHALVALAYLQGSAASPAINRFSAHRNPHLRRYAVRAAAVRSDLAALRRLARDRDANVREAALEALRTATVHGDDSLYIAAMDAREPQVVLAAAKAVAGSPNPDARRVAAAALARWTPRGVASERDVRVALLAVLGRPASDDRPPRAIADVSSAVVPLARGADVRLRVTMSAASGGGSFVVRVRGDVAPITAARIVGLAAAGYYDGLTWHRVEHDFVIQGGSPGASEYVGSTEYFRDELATVPHLRGTVGMSTRGHDTGDAQWFVNLKDNVRLNRDYTVFAEVTAGMDIVDGILEGDTIQRMEVLDGR